MKKTLIILLEIVLLIVAGVLTYYIVVGINKPIKFDVEKDRRFSQVESRLRDVRTAQVAFKDAYGEYTPSFDTLINFIKEGDLKIVRAIGFVPDTLTEQEAIKLGIVSRDTIAIPVKDTLFKHINYKIEELGISPVGKKSAFVMDTASVLTGSGVVVKVFQCYSLYFDMLDGLDRQLIVNYNALRRDTAMRVGSLKEANNNAGNWE